MKILLKKAEASDFLDGEEHWTRDPKKAQDFHSAQNAMQHCQAHHYTGLDIILKFPDSRYDVVLENCCF